MGVGVGVVGAVSAAPPLGRGTLSTENLLSGVEGCSLAELGGRGDLWQAAVGGPLAECQLSSRISVLLQESSVATRSVTLV